MGVREGDGEGQKRWVDVAAAAACMIFAQPASVMFPENAVAI